MAGKLTDADDEITDINVTPFVDVMLVLLVIFMVTANYIVNQSINVNLPDAVTGEVTSSNNLAFSLDQKSNLYLDGKPIDFSAINEEIIRRQMKKENLQAVIAADEKTPHGAVIKLIDTIRKSGITDFSINVEQLSAPQ